VKDEEEIVKYIDSISFLAWLFDVKINVKPMQYKLMHEKLSFYKWRKEERFKEWLKECDSKVKICK
jgi:hypothetical protein